MVAASLFTRITSDVGFLRVTWVTVAIINRVPRASRWAHLALKMRIVAATAPARECESIHF